MDSRARNVAASILQAGLLPAQQQAHSTSLQAAASSAGIKPRPLAAASSDTDKLPALNRQAAGPGARQHLHSNATVDCRCRPKIAGNQEKAAQAAPTHVAEQATQCHRGQAQTATNVDARLACNPNVYTPIAESQRDNSSAAALQPLEDLLAANLQCSDAVQGLVAERCADVRKAERAHFAEYEQRMQAHISQADSKVEQLQLEMQQTEHTAARKAFELHSAHADVAVAQQVNAKLERELAALRKQLCAAQIPKSSARTRDASCQHSTTEGKEQTSMSHVQRAHPPSIQSIGTSTVVAQLLPDASSPCWQRCQASTSLGVEQALSAPQPASVDMADAQQMPCNKPCTSCVDLRCQVAQLQASCKEHASAMASAQQQNMHLQARAKQQAQELVQAQHHEQQLTLCQNDLQAQTARMQQEHVAAVQLLEEAAATERRGAEDLRRQLAHLQNSQEQLLYRTVTAEAAVKPDVAVKACGKDSTGHCVNKKNANADTIAAYRPTAAIACHEVQVSSGGQLDTLAPANRLLSSVGAQCGSASLRPVHISCVATQCRVVAHDASTQHAATKCHNAAVQCAMQTSTSLSSQPQPRAEPAMVPEMRLQQATQVALQAHTCAFVAFLQQRVQALLQLPSTRSGKLERHATAAGPLLTAASAAPSGQALSALNEQLAHDNVQLAAEAAFFKAQALLLLSCKAQHEDHVLSLGMDLLAVTTQDAKSSLAAQASASFPAVAARTCAAVSPATGMQDEQLQQLVRSHVKALGAAYLAAPAVAHPATIMDSTDQTQPGTGAAGQSVAAVQPTDSDTSDGSQAQQCRQLDAGSLLEELMQLSAQGQRATNQQAADLQSGHDDSAESGSHIPSWLSPQVWTSTAAKIVPLLASATSCGLGDAQPRAARTSRMLVCQQAGAAVQHCWRLEGAHDCCCCLKYMAGPLMLPSNRNIQASSKVLTCPHMHLQIARV